MASRDTIREVALRYFAGRADAGDEQTLYDFVVQDRSHRQLLKQWEIEWRASAPADPGTAREWERLKLRLALHDEAPRMHPFRPRTLLRRIASVAAMIVVGLCGLCGVWKIASDLAPERYYTVEVPRGEKSRIVLSDGSVVWLNAGSTLTYSDRFGALNRRVELRGEGYFEVAKRHGAAFRIDAGPYQICVTGTRFDVSAYPEDDCVTTTLAEGSVELTRGEQRIRMQPGEAIRFDRQSGVFRRSRVDPAQAYSWTENRLEFDDITLRMLLAKLSRQYDVRIFLESDSVKEKRFHISLRNDETIREVLDALKEIIPVRYEYRGDDIYIREMK